MREKSKQKEYVNLIDTINEIADEINSVLDERKKEKYFEDIILLYSFIENLLRWIVFVRVIWERAEKESSQKECNKLANFYGRLNFYQILNVALSISLIEFKLYKQIDQIRKERNNIVHNLWLFKHRNNFVVLRKKLEKLARIASALVGIFNNLSEEIGIDEIFKYLF